MDLGNPFLVNMTGNGRESINNKEEYFFKFYR
jgi:hypothetical protein